MANPNTKKDHWRGSDGVERRIIDSKPGTVVMIQVTEADVACAVPKDPHNCAIAQAWKRQAGMPDAQIGIDKAYLPMRIDGEDVALRLKVPAPTKRQLEHFDRTGEFPGEAFALKGIPKSETMKSKRAEAKRLRDRYETLGRPVMKKKKSLYLRSATHPAVEA